MIRMPEYRHSRRALDEGEGGRKKMGRAKKIWFESVMADLQVLGVMDWKRVAQNKS